MWGLHVAQVDSIGIKRCSGVIKITDYTNSLSLSPLSSVTSSAQSRG